MYTSIKSSVLFWKIFASVFISLVHLDLVNMYQVCIIRLCAFVDPDFLFILCKWFLLSFFVMFLFFFNWILLAGIDLCIFNYPCADTGLWQQLFDSCYVQTCCCHGSVTQQALLRWLLCPLGAGEWWRKSTSYNKNEALPMWIIQLSRSGGSNGGSHVYRFIDFC